LNMSDTPQISVRVLASGATAQLRSLVEFADREEARRICAELRRIATQLENKYQFGKVKEVREVRALG
jgi:hypothetical protein